MKENIENLQKLGKEINLNLFYLISFFANSETSLQGKGTSDSLHELNGHCTNFEYNNSNLIGFFEFEDVKYRVVLTF